MSLAAFIDKSLQLDDPGQLFAAYVSALGEFGVDRVLYSALDNTPHQEASLTAISHCYPEDWVNYYVERDYMSRDPVRKQCALTRCAFTWDEMMQVRDLSDQQILLMNEGDEAGLKNGLAVPLHGPLGEVYGIGMASSEANRDVGRHMREIQILSTQFHVLYSALHEQKRGAQPANPNPLTPREREVLKWCAAGKSNWAIGEILSISEHGVDFHMRNILRKLEVDSRITAVVKALHGGLISL